MDKFTFIPVLAKLGVHVDVDYKKYIKSKSWQRRARICRKRAGYRCEICGRRARLDAHHKTYTRLGHELPGDLIALCKQCHKKIHEVRDDNGKFSVLYPRSRPR